MTFPLTSHCPGYEKPDDTRLSRKVMHQLLEEIRVGRHPIGSRLPPERELANRIGVSRPIIREAILALDLLGLVGSRVGSGTYVIRNAVQPLLALPHASPFELADAIRATEETIAAGICLNIEPSEIARAERELETLDSGTVTFRAWHEQLASLHLRLAKASGNVTMVAVLTQLWEARNAHVEFNRMLSEALRNRPLRMEPLFAPLFRALRGRDAASARSALAACHRACIAAILDVHAARQLERVNQEAMEMRRLYCN